MDVKVNGNYSDNNYYTFIAKDWVSGITETSTALEFDTQCQLIKTNGEQVMRKHYEKALNDAESCGNIPLSQYIRELITEFC